MISLYKAPPPNHKRRLSSGSESEATMAGAGTGKKKDKTVDALSPKKPRLQKNSPKAAKKHKDRNPFRYCFNFNNKNNREQHTSSL
jgi:hypothetical protein